ncbi:MAG: polyribonucleotide nucleotidyltransferase [Candidatus Kapabacteria bacterium]|nr:polyribonucleotide nucleotidyltransferase [Candidatus Kapabacteria bacterium]
MKTVSRMINGKELSFEVGRFAKLADAAVMVRYADTMVLVTAQAAPEPKDLDFLPLTCEYREKHASSGKIPGSFFRREARPTTKETLASRLIDRPIRPLFPKAWRHETQVIATVYSFDMENEPDVLAALGASAALSISTIPFEGPIAEVRVGRVDGEFIVNPTIEQTAASDLEILVAGSDESIVMVEGASKEISEADFIAALDFAHTWIRELNALQRELVALVGQAKTAVVPNDPPADIIAAIDAAIVPMIQPAIRQTSTKEERGSLRKAMKEAALAAAKAVVEANEAYAELAVEKIVSSAVKSIEAREMREMILTEGRRLDGRSTTQIRPITCDIGVLPRPHGSALFTRGETQSLTTVTLGTKTDQQIVDGLMPTYERRYMLHYNFPPFSTGETGRFGFTSRREIGHGDLAERSLEHFIPDERDFSYTIRVVSDILESNGSSSMATVCAGSLALFHAGVPMKKAVAGIAMGLIKEGDRVAVLSDILGDEDFLGDMDFKVTGTSDGITACQMDIKIGGLSVDIMRTALEQARVGRLHILDIMNQTIAEPNAELSPYAPKLTTIMIPVEMIGAVIGPGGETIRGIVKDTGAEINIDDDGSVTIAAVNQSSADAAIARIRDITRPVEVGATYTGKVKEIKEGLGAIVEILPKKQGLLHISQLDYRRVATVGEILKVGDTVDVKLLELQPDGKMRLSRRALLPAPEGWVEDDRGPRDRGGDRGGRGGRDRDRGGDRGGRFGDRDRGGYGDRDRGPRDDRGYGDRDRGPRDDRGYGDRDRGPRDDRGGDRDRGPRDDRGGDRGPRPPRDGERGEFRDGRPREDKGPAFDGFDD